MTALCNSCDQPFDANNYCPRCEHYASEQLPEKTLDQLLAEHPEISAYRDQVRAGLWVSDVLGEQLERDLRFTAELGDAARAARAVAASRSRRVSPSRPSGLPSTIARKSA